MKLMKNNEFSKNVTVFHGRSTPEPGTLAGYAALIEMHDISTPLPETLAIISYKHKRYDTDNWKVFTPKHVPENTLYGHLLFALKYEPLDLYVLKTLFKTTKKTAIETIIRQGPIGVYRRKIWFLYEWLMDIKLDIPDLKIGNYVDLLDPSLQYPGSTVNSPRHRIRNNLPGTKDFCPLIRRIAALEKHIRARYQEKARKLNKSIHKDLLRRSAAFLLLKDSKASFSIEGESPSASRAQRWAKVIGQAGEHPLTMHELIRLQKIIIMDTRFTKLGWRKEGGFVGEHDRSTGTPMPDHISCSWQDVKSLMNGLITAWEKIQKSNLDPVLAAASIAFGFVFIHPFADGNGRLHRYLIHHILAQMDFALKASVFPVSAAMLEKVEKYKATLESYSIPRLDLIKWEETSSHNIKVMNDTKDLYSYFDATKQAEFLYDCIQHTVDDIIPHEVRYLQNYDRMRAFVQDKLEMPDSKTALLIRFLEQGHGELSGRARKKEFKKLTDLEVTDIEKAFKRLLKKS